MLDPGAGLATQIGAWVPGFVARPLPSEAAMRIEAGSRLVMQVHYNTLAGPGEPDFAMCRVRVREDRRFLIYPRKFADSIQKVGYSRDFWNKYLGEYDDVYVDDFREPTGLGKGFGSFTEATYTTAEGTIMRKRGLMFASLYHDKAYIVDCSAEESVYEKWRPAFMGVVKSVDFEKVVHELPSGNYRNFMADPQVVINGGPKKVDVYRY